jgi:hypothetical protein
MGVSALLLTSGAASAEKQSRGTLDSSPAWFLRPPPGVGTGVGFSRAEALSSALQDLAEKLDTNAPEVAPRTAVPTPSTTPSANSSDDQTATFKSITGRRLCGFHVKSSLTSERSEGVREGRDFADEVIKLAITVRVDSAVSDEYSADFPGAFMIKSYTEMSATGAEQSTERSVTTLARNSDINQALDHLKKNDCDVRQSMSDGRVYMLVSMASGLRKSQEKRPATP